MRDRAIEGLVTLACREVWRASEDGNLIVDRVKTALSDENPLVRMHAAHGFRAVYANESHHSRIGMLGDLLRREPDANVKHALLWELGSEAYESPLEVDEILRQLAEDQEPTDEEPRDDNGDDLAVDILLTLALRDQTPFATESLRKWALAAPRSAEALRAIYLVRDYLAPNSDPPVQERAFDFIGIAADASLERWSENLHEHSPNALASQPDLNELNHSLKILDNIANQIYFASGAFDAQRNGAPSAEPNDGSDSLVPSDPHERFADSALPVLMTCSRTKVAPIVHHVVETLIYLAPLDEQRALLAVADAAASDGVYAADPLSGDVVIPYLRRLLAEQRSLVLFDDGGVTAFRKLLEAFASSGNESALALVLTFAEVFR
jgi:hypothetical protein